MEALARNSLKNYCSPFQKCVIIVNPAGICLLKVNNRNTRARCEICSKLTIKTPERHECFTPCSSVSIANFEHEVAMQTSVKLLRLTLFLFTRNFLSSKIFLLKKRRNAHLCNENKTSNE